MNLIDITKNEKVLESAYDAYNKKVDSIIESKEYKDIEEKATNFSKEINTNLMKAFKEFIKLENKLWLKIGQMKKNKKIKEVYEYIIKKLYDQDEIDRFNKMMENTIIIGSCSDKQKDLLEM